MASADFCLPISTPRDADSLWQGSRPPEVMRATFPLIPAASTSAVSVQASGFESLGLLIHCDRLICDSCSSGQCFAFGFLQIPPHDGHPCRSANRSPCQADSGLSPPSHPATTACTGTAPVGATRHTRRTKKNPTDCSIGLFNLMLDDDLLSHGETPHDHHGWWKCRKCRSNFLPTIGEVSFHC